MYSVLYYLLDLNRIETQIRCFVCSCLFVVVSFAFLIFFFNWIDSKSAAVKSDICMFVNNHSRLTS